MPSYASIRKVLRRGLCHAVSLLIFGAAAVPQSHPIRFDHLTTGDGLSQDIVTSIVVDAHGFMWFGTEDGLNRYDGYAFQVFKYSPSDSLSLSSNSVSSLMVDSRGRLWASTTGLNLFDEKSQKFTRFRHSEGDVNSLPCDHISAMCEDGSGFIWAGTDEGLGRLDPHTGAWQRFIHRPSDASSPSSNYIRSLMTDREKILWIGSDGGLDRYEATTQSFKKCILPSSAGLAAGGNVINVICEGEGNVLWLGTNGGGLLCFDRRTMKSKRFIHSPRNTDSPADNLIFDIKEDQRGRLWIGHFAGLDIFEPRTGKFEHYFQSPDDPDALFGGRVYAIFADSKGAMWLGTYHGGVERFDPHRQKFSLFRSVKVPGIAHPESDIISLLEDRNSNIWTGTLDGAAVVRPVFGVAGLKLEPSSIHPSLVSDEILAMFQDRRRSIWIGHDKPGGIDRLDERGNVTGRYPIPGVRAIAEDRDGNLWLGTRDDGLAVLSPRTGKTKWFKDCPGNSDSLWGNGVWSLFMDKRNSLWIGTSGVHQSLNRYDFASKRFTHFPYRINDPHTLPGLSIRSFFEDTLGYLWIGFWGEGFARYDRTANEFRRYAEGDGLPSNYVKAILGDAHNRLWISTERGISRFTPATGEFRSYTIDDGLQGDRYYSGSALITHNGYLYFGGDHGMNVFHPDSMQDDRTPPSVRLTSFRVFDKPLTLGDALWNLTEIELPYEQDFFSFEFVALDYSVPQRNRYAYMLEGLDRSWIDAGTRRYAAYTHLDAGRYRFRVKASNGDGVWNDEGAAIDILIRPPYWQTAWFRSLVLILITASLYGAYRVRLSRVLAVERLRQRIAQDLHDDVGTNLSTIALASRSLAGKRRSGKEAVQTLQRIGAIAQRTTDQMKDIVWILKASNDSLDNIVTKMRELAGQILPGIHVVFTATGEHPLEKVDLEFKRNIYLFYKECLNNIAKHSGSTEAMIKVQSHGGNFLLEVSDNGRGFDEAEVVKGSGLQNLRARGKQMGAEVEIESSPGKGTVIRLIKKMTHMRHSFRHQ